MRYHYDIEQAHKNSRYEVVIGTVMLLVAFVYLELRWHGFSRLMYVGVAIHGFVAAAFFAAAVFHWVRARRMMVEDIAAQLQAHSSSEASYEWP
jgi:TRAP-type C4-dicarboxylate transport system permease large subunit